MYECQESISPTLHQNATQHFDKNVLHVFIDTGDLSLFGKLALKVGKIHFIGPDLWDNTSETRFPSSTLETNNNNI